MTRVVWSSFWPASPHDTIELDLTDKGDHETAIRLRWFTNSPPDARGVGITRRRLNAKISELERFLAPRQLTACRPDATAA